MFVDTTLSEFSSLVSNFRRPVVFFMFLMEDLLVLKFNLWMQKQKIMSLYDVEALKKCREENKGSYVKCQIQIEAFKSSSSLKKSNPSTLRDGAVSMKIL
ncbi:hypothetical protein K1719_020436 [Acacia pycnantha]|nr:hypothetical protein K1719_043326 [Acacia pycnantha]KAI9108552.1 hypothetical protein K1719_020436 [Acacia pycnantha]